MSGRAAIGEDSPWLMYVTVACGLVFPVGAAPAPQETTGKRVLAWPCHRSRGHMGT
jgi:hypothetical protein